MTSTTTPAPSPAAKAPHPGVPFLDLKAQYAQLREEVVAALVEVAESGCYVLGPRVEAFERAFADYTDARHCVALNSGTSALHLALLAAGVGPGDEVIAPAMTFIATAWAIRYVGAKPVFADVDADFYTLDPEDVERKITSRTRAILPVHLYGQPASLHDLAELAAQRGVTIIEDAAQAHGAMYGGRHVGTTGLCGCFSFYPGKNLGAYGEGGAVVTDDDEAARRMRSLRDHAQRQRYCHEELGFNYRMDAFQGAVLSIKLKYLDAWTAARQRLAERYLERLAELPLVLPRVAADRGHVWHLFVALHPERDRIRAALAEQNIQTGLHYPVPLHLQPAFHDLGHVEGDFPVSERIGRECFSLPIYPEMTDRQQDLVIEALKQATVEERLLMPYSLENATVLVTGGAGLIGSHIVDLLFGERVREVRVLDNLVRGRRENLQDAWSDGRLVFLEDDVRDATAVDRAVAGCDCVFHQAAIRITLCAQQPRDCIDVLVGGTFNVFEAAVKHQVRKVVYASSASVYGAAEEFPTNEKHHPYGNRTLYGAAKLMNEGIARSFHDVYGLPSVGLRYFNVYGPRMDITGAYTEVLVRWLDCVDQGRPPQIHGDGSTSMDFVFSEDIARANLLAMKSDRVDDVYNVGSGTETSLKELWEAVARVAGGEGLTPECLPPRNVNPVPRRLADVNRAERELGFRAAIGLDEGLRRLIAWRRESVQSGKVCV